MKDPLFINKIVAAVLTALFVILMTDFILDDILKIGGDDHGSAEHAEDGKEHAPKFAYNIEVPEQEAGVATEAVVVTAPDILGLIASANIESGEKVAKKCTACHTFTKAGPNRIGPNQWDIVARARGTTEGFSYSEALLASGGAWDYESLNQFLYSPKNYIAGTKMNFAGIKGDQDRASLILWLRSLSDNPVPLP